MSGDVFAGYETSMFQLPKRQGTQGALSASTQPIVFDPSLFVEIASHNYVEVNLLNFVKFRFRTDLEAFRYDFMNLELVWSLNNDGFTSAIERGILRQLCYGLSWDTRSMFIRATTELLVYECSVGIIGLATSSKNTGLCEWKKYTPDQPLWAVSLTQLLGITGWDLAG